jgi:hypothetical protein
MSKVFEGVLAVERYATVTYRGLRSKAKSVVDGAEHLSFSPAL